MASLATAARLLTIPDGPSSRVRTIALIIGAFTLVYRYCLRAKGDWNGLEPPHKLIDSLYFSATVFSAPPARLPAPALLVLPLRQTPPSPDSYVPRWSRTRTCSVGGVRRYQPQVVEGEAHRPLPDGNPALVDTLSPAAREPRRGQQQQRGACAVICGSRVRRELISADGLSAVRRCVRDCES